ncbi:MAG: transcription-repair coupling factor [Rickettsiaceae bacterium]|nr:transcription-repair coupling factor [Rickettsiaceae bacterium]
MKSISKYLLDLIDRNIDINSDIFIVSASDDDAANYYEYLNFFLPTRRIHYYPSLDTLPYDRVSPSKKILSMRARCAAELAAENRLSAIVVTSIKNLLTKYPKKEEYVSSSLRIKAKSNLSRQNILDFLQNNGYERSSVAYDPGEYSVRGDIIDIALESENNLGIRIIFEWDKISSVRYFDTNTQGSKTKDVNDRPSNLEEEITIYRAQELLLTAKNIENFKLSYLKKFGIPRAREPFFEKICANIKDGFAENIVPIFYQNTVFFTDYLRLPKILLSGYAYGALSEHCNDIQDFYKARLNSSEFYPAFEPSDLYFSEEEVKNNLSKFEQVKPETKSENNLPNFVLNAFSVPNITSYASSIQLFVEYAKKHINEYKIIILSKDSGSRERMRLILKDDFENINNISNFNEAKPYSINIGVAHLEYSFKFKDALIFSENDITTVKKGYKASRSGAENLKNILKDYENFAENDLVVHKDHGIARYLGIEHIDVEGIRHDCLKLLYQKGDRLFVPVENIELVKKYGEGLAQIDSLGSASWQRRKASLKDRIGQIAHSLIEAAAKRASFRSELLEIDLDEYNKFCDKFPYAETEDQLRACNEVYEDLSSDKIMDRLICGDVGFGKTEVAIRAAFLVASSRQVAVIVPTTILAKQHYNNFTKRFEGFNVKIQYISRLVNKKDQEQIKQDLTDGKIDIIIGTHAVLSLGSVFKNLGLIIIDEEQHFGVAQKEKLRRLSEKIHTLSLSATPIPRTLHMSMSGIKDLSLITSPPIDRLVPRTTITEFDELIIREALIRERERGGKSLFVCPRIEDISEILATLTKLVPELKIEIAHGKLAPSKIDKIMSDFYDGVFDVLLSTAIVESGLDIDGANTILIYKAEIFGLSQLYQLRGRVGRGKLRSFAYLITDKKKMPTKEALKRLEIIQSIDSLGAGFMVASHDIDMRGFGNIIGDEQSGHIKEVGIELYQELLEEAINKLKQPDYKQVSSKADIKIRVPVYIPEEFIDDQKLRLSIYKRISALDRVDAADELTAELADRFGSLPEPLINLIEIVKIKILCEPMNIESIDVGTNAYVVKFFNNVDAESISKFISANVSQVKIRPDNKLIYNKDLKSTIPIRGLKDFVTYMREFFDPPANNQIGK